MAESAPAKTRVKFGQRLVRGFMYGLLVGFIVFLIGAVLGGALYLMGMTTIKPMVWGAIGFGLGFVALTVVEIIAAEAPE